MKKRRLYTLTGLLALARYRLTDPQITYEEIRGYMKYFKTLSFWAKCREVIRIAGRQILLPVLRLWFVWRSPSTPLVKKAYILGALGYFIVPVDIIPDALGLLGFTDDLAVVMMISKWVDDLITPEIEERARATYQRLMRESSLP